MSNLKVLFDSLQMRYRPEEIAGLIAEELADKITLEEKQVINKVASHSYSFESRQASSRLLPR